MGRSSLHAHMLEGLKRWFGGATSVPGGGIDALTAWAESRQYTFRGVRAGDGFVIDGRVGAAPWRLEWGPSQRAYIAGGELRLRAELGFKNDLQAVVMNRKLQERMEREVFDQYVEGVQTRIDNQTPPEARWLVMFPKLGAAELGRMRDRWVALASIKPFLVGWLDGPLAAAFAALKVEPSQPTVLMIGRGRLTLRTALSEPEARDLEPWIRFFETAMREARRAQNDSAGSDAPSTQPSMWSATELPRDGAR